MPSRKKSNRSSQNIKTQFKDTFDSHILESLEKVLGQDEAIKMARHCSENLAQYLLETKAFENKVRLVSEDERKILRASVYLINEVQAKIAFNPSVMQFNLYSRRYLGKKYVKLSTRKEDKIAFGESEKTLNYLVKAATFQCCYFMASMYKMPQCAQIVQYMNQTLRHTDELEVETKRVLLTGTPEVVAGITALLSIINFSLDRCTSFGVAMNLNAEVMNHISKIRS